MIKVEKITVQVDNLEHFTNSYVMYDENHNAIVIDPGGEAEEIIEYIDKNELKLKYIILTHGHIDHFYAIDRIYNRYEPVILLNEFDKEAFEDKELNCSTILNLECPSIDKSRVKFVRDKEKLKIGKITLEFIHTPGHTLGSMCILEENLNVLFTGDTIFSDCYGRCDLKSGSIHDMLISLRKIFERFEDIHILPGHNEESNINNAKRRIKKLCGIRGLRM